MATIFHLALASDWAAAQQAGRYTISTRGRTLAEEGFIHASRGDQWPAVRERFYAGVTEPLVLLQIDTDRLGVPLIEEPAVPGGTETFPHIYGPLSVDAVVKAIPLDSPAQATAAALPAPTQAQPPAPIPGGSVAAGFARTYFREMFFNASLVLLVVALGFVGLVVGSNIDHESSGQQGLIASLGGLLGVAVGVALAVPAYRRRGRG
ncbi:MAG TPA: DUF952 domain-containing protein [Nocardioides sp.]|nr:DUF952 domain-containing protein [Nocardioides sp.]